MYYPPTEVVLRKEDIEDLKKRNVRNGLLAYYMNGESNRAFGTFEGTIIKKENDWLLLKNITICFSCRSADGRMNEKSYSEDHVWINDQNAYASMRTGKRYTFTAIAYAYHRNPEKHPNSPDMIDLSLKNITNIRKIT